MPMGMHQPLLASHRQRVDTRDHPKGAACRHQGSIPRATHLISRAALSSRVIHKVVTLRAHRKALGDILACLRSGWHHQACQTRVQ